MFSGRDASCCEALVVLDVAANTQPHAPKWFRRKFLTSRSHDACFRQDLGNHSPGRLIFVKGRVERLMMLAQPTISIRAATKALLFETG
ncbi:hypothetical protein Bind_2678 [Beijerinckia indica subsp. indica ATCC 9039]|uniref:Uncharacterized protein n=1 Tax=Beijerinckia indica subsp. indica (strain ATCC 9039 / DSM 1715 / NCIMB 8712) TaxID=395963 RepID=B2IJD2_BEII9|nr:hypothetical protein Bind_2678 [Beijerinckia indica subsp. indica ATCC 9039]